MAAWTSYHAAMQKRSALLLSLLILIVLNVIVGLYLAADTRTVLTVAFLDVGQGDAIFIESPSGHQMLIDGGPDRSVLRQLPKVMGPFDRSLDVVVETHPDSDHIGGLASVFTRYRVGLFIEPGIPRDTSARYALVTAVQAEKNVENVLARAGQRIALGGGAYADILYPDHDVSKGETNEGSIIMRVTYGDTCVMLSGDASDEVENYLVAKGIDMSCEVLKAGHHGSRTSTGDAFLTAVRPDIVVVSVGEDNSYGHPHEEVVERIHRYGAHILSTAEEGTVRLESNGTAFTER